MNAQNVGELLDALGARFGATGAHLWAVLIRQAYVELVEALVFCGVLSVLSVLCARKWEALVDLDIGAEIFSVVVLAVAWLIAIIILINDVGNVANPEFYALHEVLSALGGSK